MRPAVPTDHVAETTPLCTLLPALLLTWVINGEENLSENALLLPISSQFGTVVVPFGKDFQCYST